MAGEYDFQGLAARLLNNGESLVRGWLPGGRRSGQEYVCAGLEGGKGRSCSVNIGQGPKAGMWSDFATNSKGGDLISLFAAIKRVNQGEAARLLAEDENYELRPAGYTPPPAPPAPPETGPPPSKEVLDFPFEHFEHGMPVATWTYMDETGEPLMVVARYETADGKQVLPWTWHLLKNKWVCRALPEPRPLYGLQKLPEMPLKPVLVVEGEKKADAAQNIVGDRYVVLGWPGGSQAIRKVDWTPLVGRPGALLWPDADLKRLDGVLKPYLEQPGPKAMEAIAGILHGLGLPVKVLDVGLDETRADGWDAADALADGWDWTRLADWAKPRARVWGPPRPVVVEAPAQPTQALAMVEPVRAEPVVPAQGSAAEILPPAPKRPDDDESADLRASHYSYWEQLGIATTKGGNPHFNVDNVLRFLEHEKSLTNYLWYDDFHCKIFTQFDLVTFQPLDRPREWRDIDEIQLLTYIQRHVGLVKMGLDTVGQAVRLYASEHVRNEPRDWLKTLVWDGQSRIEAFLAASFGCELTEYTAAASSNWLKSIAARIMNPGCKVDTMLILRGEQGLKKSQSLRALGGAWFAEVNESVDSKDFYLSLQGKAIIELSEMAAFSKAGADAIKKMLSTQTDRFRVPYGKSSQDHPRACVFAGSTNESFFLNDPTGARRFWPITCTRIDVEFIIKNREQIFAEAAARVKAGERWWEMPDLETREVQELHRQIDDWESVIMDWASGNIVAETTVAEAAMGALLIPAAKLDSVTSRRIGRVLTTMGWTVKVQRIDGVPRRTWIRPDK